MDTHTETYDPDSEDEKRNRAYDRAFEMLVLRKLAQNHSSATNPEGK